jgi:hypothetical protein
MATTTNYGWTTPDDSALVKDGASAIRTLGSSIDTTLKAQIDAQIPDSLLTTTGDTIYASGASTPARLGIGTSGQVLTVSGGVPTWATSASGSMTSLASGSLSGSSVTINSISGSYKALRFQVFGLSTSAQANIFLRMNGNAGGSDYSYAGFTTITVTTNNTAEVAIYPSPSALTAAGTTNFFNFDFPNYTSTTSFKDVNFTGNVVNVNYGGGIQLFGGGGLKSTSAITSISIHTDAGTFDAGTYILYGVN